MPLMLLSRCKYAKGGICDEVEADSSTGWGRQFWRPSAHSDFIMDALSAVKPPHEEIPRSTALRPVGEGVRAKARTISTAAINPNSEVLRLNTEYR